MNKYKYFVTICAIITVAVFFIINKDSAGESNFSNSSSNDLIATKYNKSIETDKKIINKQHSAVEINGNLSKLAIEATKAICIEEKNEITKIVFPPLKNTEPGTEISMEEAANSTPKLSVANALELLNKITNSKCSSFRKNNTFRLFFERELTKDNFKQVYEEYNDYWSLYDGLNTYLLIKKALEALDGAAPPEQKPLNDAILRLAHKYITDASTSLDLHGAIEALNLLQTKGLISYPTSEQLVDLKNESRDLDDEIMKKRQQLNSKYFPRDADYMNMASEQFANILGFEGVKARREIDQYEFNSIQRTAGALKGFMK